MPTPSELANRDQPAQDVGPAAVPPQEDGDEAASRLERELFSRMARVKQYPISHDEDVPPTAPDEQT